MPENKAAIDIFQHCRTQVLRAGMNGMVIDINLDTVWHTIEHYPGGIRRPWEIMCQIRHLFDECRPKNET